MANRNFTIDFLRFIGLSLIVLAHVETPWVIVQLRSFDVPLMVFVSALCFKPVKGYMGGYLWKRFKRLYIPTFIFLCLFFTLIGTAYCLGVRIPYSGRQVVGSFLLLQSDSIGYVWIIRVFILMALIAPCIHRLLEERGVIAIIFLSILLYFGTNILSKGILDINNKEVAALISDIIIYTCGYGVILCLGFVYKKLSSERKRIIAISSAAIILTAIIYSFISSDWLAVSDRYKYPPHSYFILYGILWCTCLGCLKFKSTPPPLQKTSTRRVIEFISIHSMWIYLWHIPFVVFLNWLSLSPDLWVIKWLSAYGMAVIITFSQTVLVKKIIHNKSVMNYLIN